MASCRLSPAILAVMVATLHPAFARAQATGNFNVISAVRLSGEGPGAIEIVGSLRPNFTTFSMADPARLVVDLSESVFDGVPPKQEFASGPVKSIRVASYGTDQSAIARVLITFTQETETDIQTVGETMLRIRIGPAPAAAAGSEIPEAPTASATATTATEPAATTSTGTAADAPGSAAATAAPTEAATPTTAAPAPAADGAQAAAQVDAKPTQEDVVRSAAEEKQRLAEEERQRKLDEKRAKEEAAKLAAEEKKRQAEEERQRKLEEKRAKEEAAKLAAEERKRQAEEARAVANATEVKAGSGDDEDAARAAADERKRLAAEERQRKLDEKRAAEESARAAAAEKKRLAAEERQRKLEEQRAAAAEAKAAAEEKKRLAAEERQLRLEEKRAAAAEAKAAAEEKKRLAAEERQRKLDEKRAAKDPAVAPESAHVAVVEGAQGPERRGGAGEAGVLELVGYRQVPQAARVFVRTSAAVSWTVRAAGDGAVAIDLENTSIGKRNNARPFDASFFDGPVAQIAPSRAGRNVRVLVKLKSPAAFDVRQEGHEIVLEFPRSDRSRYESDVQDASLPPASADTDGAAAVETGTGTDAEAPAAQ